MTAVLTPAEVEVQLAARHLGWRLEDGALVKVTRHGDFARALSYVNEVGARAEAVGHHPDIGISWETVTLRLSTHSAGGITEADLSLAATLDALGATGGSAGTGAG